MSKSNIHIGGASSNQALVQSILNSMASVIQGHNLELLERYPGDLDIDRQVLEGFAVPGAKLAWVAGHTHSYIVPLGLNLRENFKISYLTNLCKDDRFHVIAVHEGGHFTITEVSRERFISLQMPSVPYHREGGASGFYLNCHQERVGYVELKDKGTWWDDRKIVATVTPVDGISALDRSALEIWCRHAIAEFSRSLFVRQEVTWVEPIRHALAA